MEKKKIITIVIVVFALLFFVAALIFSARNKKADLPGNAVVSAPVQKNEIKDEPEKKDDPKKEISIPGQPVVAVGQVISLDDQGMKIKTESGELSLKFKTDTKVMTFGGTIPPTPMVKDKSAIEVGKTTSVEYDKNSMEINSVIIH